MEMSNITTNLSSLSNVTPSVALPMGSEREVIEGFVNDMINDWKYKARVSPWAFGSLVTLYTLMILFGASGNLLVILSLGYPSTEFATNSGIFLVFSCIHINNINNLSDQYIL